MRLSLSLIALMWPAGLVAQQPSTPPGTAATIREEVIALEQRIGQANFDCDYQFFAMVEAEEFVFTDAAGGITTRAQDLAGESDCRRSTGTYRLDDVRVMLYGGVAIFNAIATTTTVRDGAPVARRQRFTDALVWRDGRWLLVAGHSSRMPDTPR